MQKALVIISFGVKFAEQKKKCLDPCIEAIKKAYPSWPVYECFASNLLRKRLREAGEDGIFSPDEMMLSLKKAGCRHVVIQPLFMMEGKEYEKIIRLRLSFLPFMHITVGSPLLRSEEDCFEIVKEIRREYETDRSQILLLGHGSSAKSVRVYQWLEDAAARQSNKIFVMMMEERGKILGMPLTAEEIWLIPFMLVPSLHTINELNQNKETIWQKAFAQKGCRIHIEKKGLGCLESVNKIFIQRIQEQMAGDNTYQGLE